MLDYLLSHNFISAEEGNRIIRYFERLAIKKKQYLLKRDEMARRVYFIQKGCVRSFLTDYHGKEQTFLFGTEGYWMGNLQGFSEGARSTYNYQAIEDSVVLAIDKGSWDELLRSEPVFMRFVSDLFRNALIVQEKRIVELFTLSAEERYESLLNDRRDILNRVPLKYIASYIGITPEFFSLMRKQRLK
ncbi:Crp/Fnr family transcriptional regulator [Flagellimonas sp. DF-77]|uniref:Crp/Fnr family transcriptional regulator n=1 Tax=Flagellimonas algarum TaxID=3230298 RepID=UPI0033940C00